MGFPEFDPDKRKILLFSRGRGRGHAIPDIEIIRALLEIRTDVDVRVVSYRAGAATFVEFGFPVIDIGLPDISPIAEMSVLAGRLIGSLNPDLVVAHEEFAVMPAAKIFGKPAIFITDWFTDPEMYSMNALKFADIILFTGKEGIFPEPSWVREKVHYIGPVLRKFRYGRADRPRARAEAQIPQDALVLSVFPGSWGEADTPILDVVLGAFDALNANPKQLIWLAGDDAASMRQRLADREDALVLKHYWEIDRLMAATDVAITKSTRTTVFELHQMMVPTITMSFDLNPIDDKVVRGLEGVAQVAAQDLKPGDLSTLIEDILRTPMNYEPLSIEPNAHRCAHIINEVLTRACR